MKIVKEGGVSMQEKLNYKRTFFVGLAFLSICAFWQMYDNIIPLILQNTFGLGETVTGGLMAMDNVLALFLLPLFGTLSDKTETPLGKRTPFILVGTVLAVCFMLLLPVADRTQNLVPFCGSFVCNTGFHGAVPFSGCGADAGFDAELLKKPCQCSDKSDGSGRRCLCPDYD